MKLKISKLLRKYGNISDEEALRTFNLGVGLTLVTRAENVEHIKKHIEGKGVKCTEIGKIVRGSGKVNTINNLKW